MSQNRAFWNEIALSQVQRMAEIPDAKLNIGFMEVMQSVNNPQKGFSNPEATSRKISYYTAKTPIEKTSKTGDGNPATQTALSDGEFYFGDPIGEVF